MIAPDEQTFAYLQGRRYAPRGEQWARAVASWCSLVTDAAAVFDREITIDVTHMAPMVTWGTNPSHAVPVTEVVPAFEDSGATREAYERALSYMSLQPGVRLADVKIDAAFIGSCTTAGCLTCGEPLGSWRAATWRRRQAVCVPGSSAVKRSAEAEGLDSIFNAAGFEWRHSGCSMCFYAGGESFGYQQRVISSTNRNFESRQGPQTRTHIASPKPLQPARLRAALPTLAHWSTESWKR